MADKRQANDAEKGDGLSRRERQILDTVYRLGKASASEVRDALPDPPAYSSVRTHLTILQEKGHVRFESDGVRYIYEPVVPRDEMAQTAIDKVLNTFFDGSIERAVTTLLKRKDAQLSQEQLNRLAEIVEQAKKEGR